MSSILGSYFLGSGLVFNKNEAFRGEDMTPFVEMERIARETAVTLTTGIKKVLDGRPFNTTNWRIRDFHAGRLGRVRRRRRGWRIAFGFLSRWRRRIRRV